MNDNQVDIFPILEVCASEIMKVDGDRDYMNPSNLTVQQTTAIAEYIKLAVQQRGREYVERLRKSLEDRNPPA